MNYIVVPYKKPGEYIPQHDPSYVHETLEEAREEAKYDLKHGAVKQSIYGLAATCQLDTKN